MATDQNPTPEAPESVWGAAQPPAAPGPRWSGRKTLAAVAIAIGIAGAGGAVIYAASGTSAATSQQAGPGGGQLPGGGQGMGGRGMGGLSLGTTTHGEFQTGEVTDISSTAISVKSTDGYAKTYTITDKTVMGQGNSGASSIQKGATVTVIATTENGVTAATSVADRSALPAGPGQGGQQQGTPPQRDGAVPSTP